MLVIPYFSIAQIQYMHHKQFTNPAAMGAEDAFNFATYAQLRLYGFDSSPMKTALQVTIPFSTGRHDFSDASKNLYIGLTAFVQSIGIHSNYNILTSYGYKINLSTNAALTFALSLGLDVNSINCQKLLYDYDADPVVSALTVPTEYKPLGQAGAYLQSNKFYFSLYSSSIVSNRNIYLQTGFFATIGGNEDEGCFGCSMQEISRKSMFEINAQLGYINNANNYDTMIQAQANSIFTLNNFIGVGAAWEYPLKMAGIATFNLGSIKVSYCYHLDNLDKNLPAHEIFLKIKIKPKSEVF
jgi:type IX secretion system PorP/SprF family membrane protein